MVCSLVGLRREACALGFDVLVVFALFCCWTMHAFLFWSSAVAVPWNALQNKCSSTVTTLPGWTREQFVRDGVLAAPCRINSLVRPLSCPSSAWSWFKIVQSSSTLLWKSFTKSFSFHFYLWFVYPKSAIKCCLRKLWAILAMMVTWSLRLIFQVLCLWLPPFLACCPERWNLG